MAGEHGTEDGERGSSTAATPAGRRFVLVGPPGIGKGPLAAALTRRVPNLIDTFQPWLLVAPVGAQADYRTELYIASNRATAHNLDPEQDYLFRTSLVDSLAYAIVNARRLAKYESVSEDVLDAHLATIPVILFIFRHSFQYDHVFLVQQPELEDWIPEFTEAQQAILDNAGIAYTILDGDPGQWAEQAAIIIENERNNVG